MAIFNSYVKLPEGIIIAIMIFIVILIVIVNRRHIMTFDHLQCLFSGTRCLSKKGPLGHPLINLFEQCEIIPSIIPLNPAWFFSGFSVLGLFSSPMYRAGFNPL